MIHVIVDTCYQGPKQLLQAYQGPTKLRDFGYCHPGLILIWCYMSYQSSTAVIPSSPPPVHYTLQCQ